MTDFANLRRTMVDTQVRPSDVTSLPIINAMLNIPREAHLPIERRATAYSGENLVIAPGRVALAPRTLAKMIEALAVTPETRVLVIGAGGGYASAVLAKIAKSVVAVEDVPQLLAMAETSLAGLGVAVITAPLASGAAAMGPYDAILIEGAVEQVPTEIAQQLGKGGRIVTVWRSEGLASCQIGYKFQDTIDWTMGFIADAPVLPGFERTRAFAL